MKKKTLYRLAVHVRELVTLNKAVLILGLLLKLHLSWIKQDEQKI